MHQRNHPRVLNAFEMVQHGMLPPGSTGRLSDDPRLRTPLYTKWLGTNRQTPWEVWRVQNAHTVSTRAPNPRGGAAAAVRLPGSRQPHSQPACNGAQAAHATSAPRQLTPARGGTRRGGRIHEGRT